MKRLFMVGFLVALLFIPQFNFAQERMILMSKELPGAPFEYNDATDLFGKAYRWFLESEPNLAADSLRKLIKSAGIEIDPGSYYVVVANFTDSFTPIGLFHENDDFLGTRMFGLNRNNLYYIFISRQREGKSFLSVLATVKESPFMKNLPAFLGLFLPSQIPKIKPQSLASRKTWIDVRRFDIPKKFQKFSDLSFLIKSDLSAEKILASAVFDNTSRERWSYGIATAITTANDVDIKVGSDGRIIVRPKPNLDLATFAAINYHFQPVDTESPTLASSFHLLGGIRLIDFLEPIIGVGGGTNLDVLSLHLFVGYSVEIANELKSGYTIGQKIDRNIDPFKIKLRGKPRFGIEIKFP